MKKTYADKVEAVKNKYETRCLNVLNNIRTVLQNASVVVDEPEALHCDHYQWAMMTHANGNPNSPHGNRDIEISLEICESQSYEGTDEGINFAINVVEYGGRILGGLQPFNYTNDVWVSLNNKKAIEERFLIIEQADPTDILVLLQ